MSRPNPNPKRQLLAVCRSVVRNANASLADIQGAIRIAMENKWPIILRQLQFKEKKILDGQRELEDRQRTLRQWVAAGISTGTVVEYITRGRGTIRVTITSVNPEKGIIRLKEKGKVPFEANIKRINILPKNK